METYLMKVHRTLRQERPWECKCPECGSKSTAPVRFGAYECTNKTCQLKFMVMVLSYTKEERDGCEEES